MLQIWVILCKKFVVVYGWNFVAEQQFIDFIKKGSKPILFLFYTSPAESSNISRIFKLPTKLSLP